jgi:uncharacterized protein YicC (UPF0701 family)
MIAHDSQHDRVRLWLSVHDRVGTALSCEVRAVNHRYLEPGFRLPEELRSIEPALRERLAQRLSRGKVDVSLRLRTNATVTCRGPGGESAALLDQLANLAQECDARFPGSCRSISPNCCATPACAGAKGSRSGGIAARGAGVWSTTILREFSAGREREGAATATADA